ncbi:hypothetical protein NBT05_05715 [Aquimarina sp. ERC-38]|uniref:hypothetical protein n=1 Tax=Aquimarina sp. ERC-38 TaxID=2949996 RepID=UPI002247695E|nr:hypothetical protein [Aquimarina sp. ERC-38]UZO81962.1 hypothetical protein NBT05_05715 [Aquimarina sp. ERC-38]
MVSQTFTANVGVLGGATLTIGNQNQTLKFGISAIGTVNYGDVSLETILDISAGPLLKRHTIKQTGWLYSYDFYSLAGIGKNSNLLGLSLTNQPTGLLYNQKGRGGFQGIGFGFKKEFLTGELSYVNIRRGKLLMRFSNAQHSFDLTFTNDFRLGRLFNGEGTDFGVTGTLRLGYTEILSTHKILRAGVAIALFTPRPDYSLTPVNPINSDDGRKNVWYTLKPFSDTFYTNLYAFGRYQSRSSFAFAKVGLNSQKLGAFIQNTLHDGSGLNPRFPWDVTAQDKLFLEVGTGIFKAAKSDE